MNPAGPTNDDQGEVLSQGELEGLTPAETLPPHQVETTEKLLTWVPLTQAESDARGRDLAASLQRRDGHESDKRSSQSAMKIEDETILGLQETINHQQEERRIPCRKVLDFDTKTATVYNHDGSAIRYSRPMKDSELQLNLSDQPGWAPDADAEPDPWDALTDALTDAAACPSCGEPRVCRGECERTDGLTPLVAFASVALAILDGADVGLEEVRPYLADVGACFPTDYPPEEQCKFFLEQYRGEFDEQALAWLELCPEPVTEEPEPEEGTTDEAEEPEAAE